MDKWDELKAEYLAGGVTYKQLADKHGISEKTIRNHASKEGWGKDRDNVREAAGQKLIAHAKKERGKQLVQLYDAGTRWSGTLNALVSQLSEDTEALTGNMKSVEALTRSLSVMTDTMFKLNGILLPAEEVRSKASAERLKLERERFEAEVKAAAAKDGTQETKWTIVAPEGVEVDG